MHLPDAAIRAACLSQRLEAAQHLLKLSSLPSSLRLTPAVNAPQRRSKSAICVRKAAPGLPAPCHACCRTPLLQVNCAEAVAVAVPPHASSDCACLPVVQDKPRLCTSVVGTLTSESTALTLRRFNCHFSSELSPTHWQYLL